MGATKTGDTLEVEDGRGNYWVQMGLVEDVTGAKTKTAPKKLTPDRSKKATPQKPGKKR